MKTYTFGAIVLLVLIAAMAGAGYYGVPWLVERETAPLRTEMKSFSERLQAVEGFVGAEKEARKTASLKADAGLPKVVQAVNQLTAKLETFEQANRKDRARAEGDLTKLKNDVTRQQKSQEQAVEALGKDLKEETRASLFEAALANIRGHLLKARIEMSVKNLAVAKTELDLIDGLFTKAAVLAQQEGKLALAKMQDTVRVIKGEIDVNLPAAMNRLDLLWYEIETFAAKPQAG